MHELTGDEPPSTKPVPTTFHHNFHPTMTDTDTDPKYKISDRAYLTIVMHLSKYPSAISGVLLGTATTPGLVTIDRALPIAHSSLAIYTVPIAEIAIELAEQNASEHRQRIVGIYFGNEIADDTSIGPVPTRLAERVRSNFPLACLLMVHPPSLAVPARRKEHCFRLCVRDSEAIGTWGRGVRPKEDLLVSEAALALADGLLAGNGSVHDVSDFEDHFNDPRRDWLNRGIENSWPSKHKMT